MTHLVAHLLAHLVAPCTEAESLACPSLILSCGLLLPEVAFDKVQFGSPDVSEKKLNNSDTLHQMPAEEGDLTSLFKCHRMIALCPHGQVVAKS